MDCCRVRLREGTALRPTLTAKVGVGRTGGSDVVHPGKKGRQVAAFFVNCLFFQQLGGRDSNPDKQIQSLRSYRWTTSEKTSAKKGNRNGRDRTISRIMSGANASPIGRSR